ncbi:glycoprotein [Drosophila ananassae sigmavirus]|uniref:Glycoprotein n=1 Tax=Drosophila ananassae sigmavirus TaxID=1002359 RepID=A0A140D8K9_9RHAB|nr:glycoprotein [Drosophila ananassae sigmavirus]AMK09233.1 glycoprotein [Drosophila ananassae sigmavirus]
MEIVIPILNLTAWSIVDPFNLTCPQMLDYNHSPSDISVPITIKYPAHNEGKRKVPGFLCSCFSLTTRCTEAWTWSTEVSYHSSTIECDLMSCKAEIEKFKAGKLDVKMYPREDCVYARTNEVEAKYIQITPHSSFMDPYNGYICDEIFLTGRTPGNKSETIYSGTLWVLDDGWAKESLCEDWTEISGKLILPNETVEQDLLHSKGTVWAHEMPIHKLSEACSIKYCGTVGLVFPDGMWMNIEMQRDIDSRLRMFLYGGKTCEKDQMIKLPTSNHDLVYTEMNTLNAMYLMKCHECISKIRMGAQVTNYELSFLSRSYPGIGPIYRISEHGIIQAVGLYKKIKTDSRNGKQNILGLDKDGSSVTFKDWVTIRNVTYGIGGTIKDRNGEIIFPSDIVTRTQVSSELMMSTHLHQIYHPLDDHLRRRLNLSTPIRLRHDGSTNVIQEAGKAILKTGNEFTAWISKTWEGFRMYVYSVIGAILILIYTKFKKTINRDKTQGDESQGLPLSVNPRREAQVPMQWRT